MLLCRHRLSCAWRRQSCFYLLLAGVLLWTFSACSMPQLRTTSPLPPATADLATPPGFTVELIVAGLNGPTQMIVGPDGRLWVAQLNGGENEGKGQVLAVELETGGRRVLLENLFKPTGVAVHAGRLWIASGRDLLTAPIGSDASVGPPEPVFTDLPFNGRSNGTLTVTPHGEILYATTGTRLGGAAAPGSATLWALTPQQPSHPRALATGLKGAYAHAYTSPGAHLDDGDRRRSDRQWFPAGRTESRGRRGRLWLASVCRRPRAGAALRRRSRTVRRYASACRPLPAGRHADERDGCAVGRDGLARGAVEPRGGRAGEGDARRRPCTRGSGAFFKRIAQSAAPARVARWQPVGQRFCIRRRLSIKT